MARHTKFTTIPTDQHPFSVKRYHHLLDELDSAMCGFPKL